MIRGPIEEDNSLGVGRRGGDPEGGWGEQGGSENFLIEEIRDQHRMNLSDE